jgi:hypothetical protein
MQARFPGEHPIGDLWLAPWVFALLNTTLLPPMQHRQSRKVPASTRGMAFRPGLPVHWLPIREEPGSAERALGHALSSIGPVRHC